MLEGDFWTNEKFIKFLLVLLSSLVVHAFYFFLVVDLSFESGLSWGYFNFVGMGLVCRLLLRSLSC